MEEKDLINMLKRGKEEAYYELINLYGNRLLRTSFLIIKDEVEAEDVVQETFVKVFKYIKRFKAESSLYTWIYRIAQNIIKDKLRGQIYTTPYEDNEIDFKTPEDIIIDNVHREILRLELDNLSFIYKQVLVLFYFDDLTIKEIAQILDEKEGTVKSKLSRGRKLLKQALEKGGEFSG